MNENLQTAIIASLRAGKLIMDVYDSGFEVEYKDDKSPLTLADKKANEKINEHLEPTGIPIISEENKQIDYQERKHWKKCWIVDPLDGTKEFVKRNGEFTVNIALVENQIPIQGVIYVPAEKILYYNDSSSGKAYRSQVKSHETSIEGVIDNATEITHSTNNPNLIRIVGSRSHMNQETIDFVEAIKKEGKETELVSKGSSLKFCLVAEGNADVYPRYAPTMEWDTAAGQAICKAVGFEVISYETKKPLLYNRENLLNSWFLVSKK